MLNYPYHFTPFPSTMISNIYSKMFYIYFYVFTCKIQGYLCKLLPIFGHALGYFLLNASDLTSGTAFVSVMANPPKDFFVSQVNPKPHSQNFTLIGLYFLVPGVSLLYLNVCTYLLMCYSFYQVYFILGITMVFFYSPKFLIRAIRLFICIST